MRPLVVCEGPDDDARQIGSRLADEGWQLVEGFDVPGGVPPGARIACIGVVHNADDAGHAVLAAVWGAGLVITAHAGRDVIDQLCDDLRRVGSLEHHTGPIPASPLDAEQRALIERLLNGATLGDAAQELHVSRRTADRRLAAARKALGVETTSELLVEARRLRLA